MNINDTYKKYIKYKNKYLKTKNKIMHGGGKYDTYYAKYDGPDDVLQYKMVNTLNETIVNDTKLLYKLSIDVDRNIEQFLSRIIPRDQIDDKSSITNMFRQYMSNNIIPDDIYIDSMVDLSSTHDNIQWMQICHSCNNLLATVPVEYIQDCTYFCIGRVLSSISSIIDLTNYTESKFKNLEVCLFAYACMVMCHKYEKIDNFYMITSAQDIQLYPDTIINIFDCKYDTNPNDPLNIDIYPNSCTEILYFNATIPNDEELLQILANGFITDTKDNIRKSFSKYSEDDSRNDSEIIKKHHEQLIRIEQLRKSRATEYDHFNITNDDIHIYMQNKPAQLILYENINYAWNVTNNIVNSAIFKNKEQCPISRYTATFHNTRNELIALLVIYIHRDYKYCVITLPCISIDYAIRMHNGNRFSLNNVYADIIDYAFEQLQQTHIHINSIRLIKPVSLLNMTIPEQITSRSIPTLNNTNIDEFITVDSDNVFSMVNPDIIYKINGHLSTQPADADIAIGIQYVNKSEYNQISAVIKHNCVKLIDAIARVHINKLIDGISYKDLETYIHPINNPICHAYPHINNCIYNHNEQCIRHYKQDQYVIMRPQPNTEIISICCYIWANKAQSIIHTLPIIPPGHAVRSFVNKESINNIYIRILKILYSKFPNVNYIIIPDEIVSKIELVQHPEDKKNMLRMYNVINSFINKYYTTLTEYVKKTVLTDEIINTSMPHFDSVFKHLFIRNSRAFDS